MTSSQPLPHLTESDIRRTCTEQSFERGVDYYERGAIIQPTRQGHTLRAECEGSQWEPYHVEVELDAQGIAHATCTCPYDWGGYCKHIVALLLTWVHEPDAFLVLEETDKLLARMSKDELIELIQEILERHPDLHTFIARPRPQPEGRRTPVDPETYRKQVRHAIGRGVDWDEVWSLVWELRDIVRPAQEFAQAGDHANAARIYLAVVEECIEKYEWVYDKGDLSGFIGECLEALVESMRQADVDPATRQGWRRRLFELWQADDWDLFDSVYDEMIRLYADEDAEFYEDWLKEKLRERRAEGPFSYHYERDGYINQLLALYDRQGRHEDYLALCWEEDRDLQMAEKLVELGRVEEAIRVAREGLSEAHEYLRFARRLEEIGWGEEALALAERGKQRGKGFKGELLAWLAERYEQRGDLAGSLELHRRRFQERPSLEAYDQIKAIARQLGNWKTVRQALIEELEEANRPDVLLDVHLSEGEHDEAIVLVKSGRFPYGAPLERVARAVESTHPKEAIELYKRLAQRQIDHGNRKAYQIAAAYLQEARRISLQIGQGEQWEAYIRDLRQAYPRHWALQDELDKAGL